MQQLLQMMRPAAARGSRPVVAAAAPTALLQASCAAQQRSDLHRTTNVTSVQPHRRTVHVTHEMTCIICRACSVRGSLRGLRRLLRAWGEKRHGGGFMSTSRAAAVAAAGCCGGRGLHRKTAHYERNISAALQQLSRAAAALCFCCGGCCAWVVVE